MSQPEKLPFGDDRATIAGGLSAVRSPSNPSSSSDQTQISPVEITFRVSPAPLAPATVLAGRYEIIQLLGEGGMGSVYKAHDRELNRLVALKTILPAMAASESMLARFKQEVLLASQITHRNVVRLYDLGESAGLKFVTMEFIQGEDLSSVLKRHGKLAASEAVAIIRQVCLALEVAHQQGVVHRDLKPPNIMREERSASTDISTAKSAVDGRIVVMDFGLARTLGSDGMTQTGALVGTMEYMSPEQALGEDLDARSDLFAVGLIFFELLSGRVPYQADSAIASLLKRTQQRATPISQIDDSVPPVLGKIVGKCLERDREFRYQSATQVLEDLDRWQTPNALRVVATPNFTGKPGHTKWMVFGAVAFALALVIAGVGISARRNTGPSAGQKQVAATPALSVAILPFRNATADPQLEWLSTSLAEMLGTDVGQSEQLRTVSSERLRQTLTDLHLSTSSALDAETLRRLAGFVSADVVVWGQYAKVGGRIRMDATLQDLKHNRSVPIKAEAADDKQLLAAVDQLAKSVRDNLALAPQVISELQASAFKPSSSSLDALRDYNLGVQLAREGKNTEALKKFQSATKTDANFALAWSRLAQTYTNLGYDNDALYASSRATDLSSNVSKRERYLIEATQAGITHDNVRAIESYQNLARVTPDNTEVLFTLAGLYEAENNFDKARESLQGVLQRDPKYVSALLALGRVDIKSGKPQDGLEFLGRALTLSIELNNDEERGAILQATGIAYRSLNKPEEALRYYEDALAIRRRIGQKKGVAGSLDEIAQIHESLGHIPQAVAAYKESLQVRRDIGDKNGIGTSTNDLGLFYADHGQLDDALKLLKESLQIQRELGNQSYEALALNNIGHTYFLQGKYDDARTYFERALQLREKFNVPDELAETTHNLAETDVKLGQFDEAVQRYLSALDLQRKAGDLRGQAMESVSLGSIFAYQGRLGAALKSSQDAVNTFRELKEKTYWYVMVLDAYGSSLAQLGRYDEAQKVLDEAMQVARELNLPTYIAMTSGVQGDIAFYRGDFKSAREHYQKAVDYANRSKDSATILAARLNLAGVSALENASSISISTMTQLAKDAGDHGMKYESVKASLYQAQGQIARHDYVHARQTLEQALLVADKLHLRVLSAHGHALLGNALRLSGETARADAQYREAERQLAEVKGEAGSDDIMKRADLAAIHNDTQRWIASK